MTFQTVLVKSIFSEDGETEEQAPGFRGAFFHGLERIAPDVEEAKGELINSLSLALFLSNSPYSAGQLVEVFLSRTS